MKNEKVVRDKAIINYIKSEVMRGVSLKNIKHNLLSSGWNEYDVEKAIGLAIREMFYEDKAGQSAYAEKTKKSYKFKVIPILLVAIVIVGVIIFFISPKEKSQIIESIEGNEQKESSGIIDCGIDMDCFIRYSENCIPSKVVHTVELEIFGIKQKTKSYFEIKGLEADKCVFYLRTEKIELTFPPQTPEDIINQQKEIYKKLEGRDGKCKFNSKDLTSMLRKWKEGRLEGSVSCTLIENKMECVQTGDWESAQYCEGTYFIQDLS